MTFDLGVVKRQRTRRNQVFGGTTISTPDYKIHTFTVSAQLVVFSPVEADLLIVGGGGGSTSRGGAGAGGVILRTVSLQTGFYNVTIGAGGNAGIYATNGSDTSIVGPNLQLVALGGGGGAGNPAFSGGSGAGSVGVNLSGAGPRGGTPGIGLQPTSPWGGLGNDGGPYAGNDTVGGGGGAGGAGKRGWASADSSACIGGDGGPGIASDISGTVQYYAGGGGARAYIFGTGFNGPLNGYGPVAPIPGYVSEQNIDKTFINSTAIGNIYDTYQFTITITVPETGNYLVRWWVNGLSSFRWVVDNQLEFNQLNGTVVKAVRNLVINLSAGTHTISFYPVTTYTYYLSGTGKSQGTIAWAIYNEAGTVQYWNTRNHGVLTGGPDNYGGGGGPNQVGGQGVAIIRYRDI